MERREIIVVMLVLLLLVTTSYFVYKSFYRKLKLSPEEDFLPEGVDINNKFCYDSDNGLNYFQKGIVVWGVGDGKVHRSIDYCTSDDSVWGGGTLFEMYCVGNSFKIKDMVCGEGSCKEGVCIG
ncbi:MAG: hypothetical protein KKF48_02870 [Nanoarchaeota archaeon]|nr:hypothetical protein [Nanoarchaeota archaeon]MBU1027965.1 hypothetical protein [Nanoarchaeota archaeon]